MRLQVPPEEAAQAKSEPKYDVTYSGEKKLDLGFGARPAALTGPPELTWEAMRKAPPGLSSKCMHVALMSSPWLPDHSAPICSSASSGTGLWPVAGKKQKFLMALTAGGRGILAAGRDDVAGAGGGAGQGAVWLKAGPAGLRAPVHRARAAHTAAGAEPHPHLSKANMQHAPCCLTVSGY